MLLKDRIAIVTGVGPGLGRGICLVLAREGANVVLAARTRSYLEEVAKEVEALGREATVVPTDVSIPEQCQRLADATFEKYGRIDVLAHNAGWSDPYEFLVDVDIDAWRDSLHGNLTGAMAVNKAVARYMVKARRGAIINTTSRIMRQGLMRRTVYSAAKAAITVFSQSLASEVGPYGVRVNCVAPGHIWGPNIQRFYERRAKILNKTYDEVRQMYLDLMALKHVPTPEEIANAIAFMASDMASAITGQTLDVNSGHFYH